MYRQTKRAARLLDKMKLTLWIDTPLIRRITNHGVFCTQNQVSSRALAKDVPQAPKQTQDKQITFIDIFRHKQDTCIWLFKCS